MMWHDQKWQCFDYEKHKRVDYSKNEGWNIKCPLQRLWMKTEITSTRFIMDAIHPGEMLQKVVDSVISVWARFDQNSKANILLFFFTSNELKSCAGGEGDRWLRASFHRVANSTDSTMTQSEWTDRDGKADPYNVATVTSQFVSPKANALWLALNYNIPGRSIGRLWGGWCAPTRTTSFLTLLIMAMTCVLVIKWHWANVLPFWSVRPQACSVLVWSVSRYLHLAGSTP